MLNDISAIATTLNDQEDARRSYEGKFPYSAFVTHLVYLEGGEVNVDEPTINVSILDILEELNVSPRSARLSGYAEGYINDAHHRLWVLVAYL